MTVPPADEVPRPTPRQTLLDVLLALACTALVLPVSLSGIEAVPANRPVGPGLVVLTVLAVAPLAWRRHRPLTVLVVTFAAVLTMVVTRTTVALSTLGPLVAGYTAVAYATRARARAATAVLLLAFGLGALLQPVDLSTEGAIVQAIVFTGAWLLATGTRTRRERFADGLVRARDEAAHERARADAERERAGRLATEERLRISREVHDIVGHALSVMVVQASVAEQLLDADPARAREAVAEIGRTGRSSLADIRRLLGVLRATDPGAGEAGAPAPALDDLPALADGVRAAGLPVDLVVEGGQDAVPPGVALAAYRVVQEALTNSLRHAAAASARVLVRTAEDVLEVVVTDDGTPSGPLVGDDPGADAGADAFRPGHGLVGMRERVRVYGGTLEVGRGPVRGTRVRARFPLRPPQPAAPPSSPALDGRSAASVGAAGGPGERA